MIRLYLDTSYKHLHIGLQKDEQWLEKISIEAFKKQSELTMPMIEELFIKYNINPQDLDEVVLTQGPGSYTGIRISMTIAKVLGAIGKVRVYTLNTLEAMIGLVKQPTGALIDARSKRVYMSIVDGHGIVCEPCVATIDALHEIKNVHWVGDTQLIGVDSQPIDLIQNMYDLKNQWNFVENVHQLVPLYLKESNDYGNN